MSSHEKKVAFLDRDGVINVEKNYTYRIEDFEYTSRCLHGLRMLQESGYELVVVTNQAGIARGFYTECDYQKLTNWYLRDLGRKGINILKVYHCPHHPDGIVENLSIVCDCRKPKAGMLIAAGREYAIDVKSSIIVGDKSSDIAAGICFGLRTQNCFRVAAGNRVKNSCRGVVYSDLVDVASSLS